MTVTHVTIFGLLPTSAPHSGDYPPPSANWSAPSAIEARMLGIADRDGGGGTPSKVRPGITFSSRNGSLGSEVDGNVWF
jgi:hypothetical protein